MEKHGHGASECGRRAAALVQDPTASRGAGANARGKTGASEGRLHNVVTRVLTRYARSHHIGWYCNVGGGVRPLGLGGDGYGGGLSLLQQPVPLVSQHVPLHPAATDPTALAIHAVTVRARRDAQCEPRLCVINSGNATRGRDPGDACAP